MGLLQTKQLRGYNTSKSGRGRKTEEAAVVVSFGPWIKGKALLVGTCSPPLTELLTSAAASEREPSDVDFCTNPGLVSKRTFRLEFIIASFSYNGTKMNLVSRCLWETQPGLIPGQRGIISNKCCLMEGLGLDNIHS